MKRILGLILMAALLLSLVPAAQAASQKAETRPACTVRDADRNGVCDNRWEDWGKTFADENGDGVCDNRQENCGKVFADENGDGVCDNRQENCGTVFADENGDGICDNRSQAPRQGRHHGQGHHGRT